MYKLTKLIHEPETNRVFIEVDFKGFPIQKWYDPSEPTHVDDIDALVSGNSKRINAIISELGDELKSALKHPDVDILDDDDNVKVKNDPNKVTETDLKKKHKI